ncbi:hypothetical protein ER57_12430 [Smithella sp. SCADC]|jgi:hypothetical protein|nr:hypothetical protein ER57_12430 [Smithella sp. SCADC]
MVLDIIIIFIAAIIYFAVFYGIAHLKAIHIICALLFVWGGILSFLNAYLVFYPVFSSTHLVFIPGVIGFFVWSVFCLRLFLQHIFGAV